MLDAILKDLPGIDHPDLLVGLSTADDAGVFRVSADVALIQTVDFFTPIVDDPYLYGQVAAANSLSDVYAMGGRPITALNICGFPSDEVNPEVVAEILRGGQDKVTEAGAVLVGGHTVEDVEPKYGLAVTGMVHPDRVVTNAGAQPGDRLVLTKPLGTGLISDAYKSGEISEEEMQPAAASMVRLNDAASAQMAAHGAHACTDITGFGLLGHGREMAREAGWGCGSGPRRSRILTWHTGSPKSDREAGCGATGSRLIPLYGWRRRFRRLSGACFLIRRRRADC